MVGDEGELAWDRRIKVNLFKSRLKKQKITFHCNGI